ncbi:hypothetical protein [Saccharothrix sp. ALI-22-I]|nr:hypothetical protein [Saccharothrix sp. ALI-22-I]
MLRFYEDLTEAQVAVTLGVSVGTHQRRLGRVADVVPVPTGRWPVGGL